MPARLALIAVTAIYLVAEIAFNASLFSALADGMSAEQLENFKFYGRLLAASGLALVLFKFVTRRIVIIAIAAGCFYVAEQQIVDALIDRVPGDLRHRAVVLETAIRAHAHGQAVVASLPLPETVSPAAVEAMLVILPPSIAWSDRPLDEFRPAFETLAKRRAKVDDTDRLWRDYSTGISNLRGLYAAYRGEAGDREEMIQAMWSEYRSKLPANYSFFQRRIIAELHARGIMVEPHFNPADRGAFERAAGRKIDKEREALLRPDLPRGLTFTQFAALPEFASRLDGLRPDLDRATFVAVIEARIAARIAAPAPSAYMPGGELAEIGEIAAARLVVPPVALVLSSVFGLVNLAHLIALLLPLARGGEGSIIDLPIGLGIAAAAGISLALIGGNALSQIGGVEGKMAPIMQIQAGIGALT